MAIYPHLTQWLSRNLTVIDALIFDIDGVLITRGQRNRGTLKLLNLLKKNKIPYLLLTNDGNNSTLQKTLSLQSVGIDLSSEDILSCAHAITPLVQQENFRNELFFIMGDLGIPCYAQSAGLATTRDLTLLPKCRGVIVGENNYDWEQTINAVVNFFIDRPGAPFIIPNPDEFYPGQTHTIRLAAGSVGRFVLRTLRTYGTPLNPIFLGKPYRPIFQMAHNLLEKRSGRTISVNRVLMIGDNLHADIKGAIDFGYLSALVLTGVTNQATLSSSSITPGFVFHEF